MSESEPNIVVAVPYRSGRTEPGDGIGDPPQPPGPLGSLVCTPSSRPDTLILRDDNVCDNVSSCRGCAGSRGGVGRAREPRRLAFTDWPRPTVGSWDGPGASLATLRGERR